MAGFDTFSRQISVATAGLSPEAVSAALAKHARAELAKEITSGRASERYRRFVNGREGPAEEAVQAPGPIVYVFNNWPLVINAALAELRKRVRSKSGLYASSFIVIAGGRVVTDFKAIDAAAEVIIVNYQPYTRRLDASRTNNRRHFLWAYHALRRRFGDTFAITNKYLSLQAGLHPMIPYVLKGSAPRRLAAQNARSRAFREGRSFLKGRRDTEKGMPITYPAIIINTL